MNKLFSFLMLFLTVSVSFAQKSSFGIISYTVPSGYELIRNDNVLTYYKEDKSTGAYCNFFIYSTMPGHGGTQQDFDFGWINLMQNPFKFTSSANMQAVATLNGWQFLIGTAKYTDNGVATLAMLISFSGEHNTQALCILSNSDKYKTDIENFIASVDVIKEATTIISDNLSPQVKNQPGPTPEVWMKSNFEYDMMKKMSLTKYEWIAIYPDGKFHSYIPTEGYAGFYAKNKDWGKASWSGSKLNVTDASNNTYYFEKKTANQMQRSYDSKPHYYKSKSVDGLRIEGAYTQYASLIPSTKNEAQYLIWFNKDGSFDDKGISVVDLKDPYRFPDDAPGKGKYTIENYSIFLRYDNGRVKQLGFSGFLDKDPATVTDAYFIGRHIYYRKDNDHNSKLNNTGLK